ncbi:hypothetical protein QAD02_017780 [Eretmocerus hayati]|uniref:Uncharacterized protein n=2 Tax=Eretmocerus hayati TaxID=131215 RepID=A0ACC2NU82_9HYME|nr:hypothetical protein QAD02_005059 [Eretmocerus hayati]KAJ8681988.1 hypothetical protein QAD02_017780 [Eretmocerus hayati]
MENSLFCVSPLPLLSEEDIEEGLKAGPMTDEDLAWIDCIATDPSYIIYDLDNKNIRPGEKSVPCDQSVPMPVPVEIITINEEESPSNIVCEKPSFVDTIANTIDVGGDRKITMISKVERVVGNVPFDGINSHSTSQTFGTLREAIKATENLCINDGKNIVIDIVSAPIARTKPRIISDLKLDKNNRVLIKKPKQSKKVCDDIQQILKKLPKSTEVISFIKRKRIDYAKTHPKDKVGIRNPQTPIFENYANGDMFTDVFHRTHTVSGVGLLCSHLLLLGDSIETQQLDTWYNTALGALYPGALPLERPSAFKPGALTATALRALTAATLTPKALTPTALTPGALTPGALTPGATWHLAP